jgi:hypothetical protein
MVVGITTTYAISSYHHWCSGFHSRSGRGVQHYVIKFVSNLGQVGGFLRALRFLHQLNLPPRYNWNFVESGVKHHKTNQPIIMYLQRNHNWVVVWLVLTPTLAVFQLYRGVNRNWRYDLQRDMTNYTLLVFYTILFNYKTNFNKMAYSNVNSCSIMIYSSSTKLPIK